MHENIRYYGRWALLGLVISIVGFILLIDTAFALVSLVFASVPIMYAFYKKNSHIKGLEENFRIFLDDLKDLLQGGVNIGDALMITSRNDYGPLTVYIQRLAAKVRLGIPFEKAITQTFARVNSPLIKKIILVINQTLRAGGNFMKVFVVAIDYVEKIERLKSQRRSRTTATIINSYLMFYVFVMIIIAIQIFFVPMLTQNGMGTIDMGIITSGGIIDEVDTEPEEPPEPVAYAEHFMSLIIVQGLFAGPMIGKISEDSFVNGLKHSIILLVTSLTVYLIVNEILLPAI